MKRLNSCVLPILFCAVLLTTSAIADVVTATVPAGTRPYVFAINPMTNKIYVANRDSYDVTVIDGATNATTTVPVGLTPIAIAVNPVTNKIYVANEFSNTVTVIDGATNATTDVAAGSYPFAVAVNPVTNKIYVGNLFGWDVTVIDGTTNATTTVPVGGYPHRIAVNPVTNRIYVTCGESNIVTVIDGATNTTTSVPVGSSPWDVAVNPITNKIYVANNQSNTVTVIDGATNATTTLGVQVLPWAVAINTVTNKIYVSGTVYGTVTVIEGATNATTSVPTESASEAISVNPITNKIYVANRDSNNITVIDGETSATTTLPTEICPYAVAVNPVTNKAYVANRESKTVTVIDGSPFSIANVPVSDYPSGVAVNPVSNKIYVGNHYGSNVTVIDGVTNATTTVPTESFPRALAVNSVTDKIYVANLASNTVTVIDGATNATGTIPVGIQPWSIAVNPVTNKTYVSNTLDDTITMIDGATYGATTLPAGWRPYAIAVNPVTNKIYVANIGSRDVTVIDGATNGTTTISMEVAGYCIAVNPVTNKIYVPGASVSSGIVVIDGDTNITTLIPTPTGYHAVAVNPLTNRIYVGGINYVTVIDGATNATTNVSAGTWPNAIAINLVTNKIYVANANSNDITVIDGATNTTTTLPAGTYPYAVAVNAVTNRTYVANLTNDGPVMVIDESPRISQGYRAAPQPLPYNVSDPLPQFTLDATDVLNNPIIPLGVYWQMDTMQGSWSAAGAHGGNSFGATVTTALTPGSHVLYSYPVQGDAGNPTIDMGTPRIGDVSAYLFTVNGQIGPQGQAQTITFPNPGYQTYGVASISLTATASSGLQVTYRVISGPASVAGSMLTITGAGRVTVEADQAGDSQWMPALPTQMSFTVVPAVLTVTADNATMPAGGPLPAFTASYNGFVNGETQSVLSGSPSLTTTATVNSPSGTYPIIAEQGTLSAGHYTFAFVNGTLTITALTAQITSPPKGSTLPGMSATFTWTSEVGATSYSVWVGHTAGAKDIGSCGSLTLSCAVSGLPSDGNLIYVTLWGNVGGNWTVQDTATYTAVTIVKAQITAPAKGSTLNGTSVTFTWSQETGATSYQLWVGSTAGASDLGYVGTNNLAATVNGLPQNGSLIYITLYGYSLGNWSVQDTATYTTGAKARIATPAKGSTLTSKSATFMWSAETGATSYQLWVGTTAGGRELGYVGTSSLQATFSNLPTDGSLIYVTLHGYAGGAWTVQDTATYTTVTLASAQITSPPKGSTLPGMSATFTWLAETGATSYQLWVGTTPGIHDLGYVGTARLQATFSNLPTNGAHIYVTLYGYAGGKWSVQDTAIYTAFQ